MSSLPGYDLDDYISWNYDVNEKESLSELVAIFEPAREKVEDLLLNFDEDRQSWRGYAPIIDGYIHYSIHRKAKRWMISKGLWKSEKPAIIDVPDEYPLAIIGPGNTYKTTLAILLAYQEALIATHLGDRVITVISDDINLNSIPRMLSPLIKGAAIDNFFDVCKSKGIVFNVKSYSDPIGVLQYGSIVIIDEPELFIKGFMGEDVGFIPFVEKLVENDVKVISCHHLSNNRNILEGFKNLSPFKSFFITKSSEDSLKKLTSEEPTEYLSEIPPVDGKRFTPFKSFHPGIMLREEFMGDMDIMELSKKAGLKIKVIKPVTKCKAPVTQEIAEGLARAFDTTVEFWLNLQESYDDWYHRNLLKKLEDISNRQYLEYQLRKSSNVGKSSSMTSMIQVFPEEFGKTLMMERLKERDNRLVAVADQETRSRGVSIQVGEAICIAPRFSKKKMGRSKDQLPLTM